MGGNLDSRLPLRNINLARHACGVPSVAAAARSRKRSWKRSRKRSRRSGAKRRALKERAAPTVSPLGHCTPLAAGADCVTLGHCTPLAAGAAAAREAGGAAEGGGAEGVGGDGEGRGGAPAARAVQGERRREGGGAQGRAPAGAGAPGGGPGGQEGGGPGRGASRFTAQQSNSPTVAWRREGDPGGGGLQGTRPELLGSWEDQPLVAYEMFWG
eukprot:1187011-Prorocentrum_minimum.AAC.4